MFYIHQTVCISPQVSFPEPDLGQVLVSSENKLFAKETSYADIPTAVLRRMGKSAKLAVSASGPLMKQYENLDGIIIGSANGGIEDSIKFLKQIMQYEEGVLTPTNFVQSTHNAIAGQLGFLSKNKGYNNTHVHKGLAFENALLDADMLLGENPEHTYMLGGLDEISESNFNIECLCGYIKTETVSNTELYNSKTTGSIAGEGAAMFIVNAESEGAISKVGAVKTIHTRSEKEVLESYSQFLTDNKLNAEDIDLLLTGENGDCRHTAYSEQIETILPHAWVGRFKHMSGEYPTASSFALWLANYILQNQVVPVHVVKKKTEKASFGNIVIYNNYQGMQHGFMLVSPV
jgi:hypothetical protein